MEIKWWLRNYLSLCILDFWTMLRKSQHNCWSLIIWKDNLEFHFFLPFSLVSFFVGLNWQQTQFYDSLVANVKMSSLLLIVCIGLLLGQIGKFVIWFENLKPKTKISKSLFTVIRMLSLLPLQEGYKYPKHDKISRIWNSKIPNPKTKKQTLNKSKIFFIFA